MSLEALKKNKFVDEVTDHIADWFYNDETEKHKAISLVCIVLATSTELSKMGVVDKEGAQRIFDDAVSLLDGLHGLHKSKGKE